MPEASVGAPALIEWGVASLALPGEAESGDRHLVTPVGTGVLVAAFSRHDRSMTWVGVGNVEGLLLYGDGAARSSAARASLVTRGGIVGSELPRLHPVVLAIAPGDTLFFATDGIREGFAEGLSPEAAPQQLADQILARHGKGTDDALVLVARYLGGAGTRG